MQHPFPTHSLIKLSVVLSMAIATMLTIFLTVLGNGKIDILFRFIEIVLFALLVSLANVWLSTFWYKMERKQKVNRTFFYVFSYMWSFLAWIIVRFLYSAATGEEWEGEHNALRAYFLGVSSIWIFNSLSLMIQNLVIVQYNNAKSEIENLQLKNNLTDASNLLLRQQIQPHFLFNALTTMKSLYKQNHVQGEEYLLHLANFLRVSLSNRTTQTVEVKAELEFCMNYIKMQSIRFGDALKFKVEISDYTLTNKCLPYFSLQPLIENALKHNDFTEVRPIMIILKEENGYILVCNNLQPRKLKPESTGNGLYNLSERYRLLGEEEIGITTEDNLFTVRLKILDK